ncbi:MAG: prepilin-type N-terminal cleavage/methylation domain-containing protein [Candidatus Omnitrophica bacterium]|nr:prepilin-type N-terminal cleavage/methylation domain-containing protein [Candidatus Omnitrophota bacterium]
MNNRCFCNKAFTLMEILVSMIIFSLLVMSFAALIVTGKRYIASSRARIAGGEIGKYFLDPLQLQVRQDQWGNNCLSAGINCDTANWIDPSSGIVYTPAYNFSDVNNLRKLKLTLTWNEPQ